MTLLVRPQAAVRARIRGTRAYVRFRATRGYVRPRVAHYSWIGFSFGYTLTQLSSLFHLPGSWPLVGLMAVGVIIMVAATFATFQHDYVTCGRCVEAAPYMAGRLARLEDPERVWRRLRWQHWQFPWAMIVVFAFLLVGEFLLLLTGTSPPLIQTVYSWLMVGAFWWADCWLTYHHHYKYQCQLCIRRRARIQLKWSVKEVRRVLDAEIMARPEPPADRPARPPWFRRWLRTRRAATITPDNPSDQSKSRDT